MWMPERIKSTVEENTNAEKRSEYWCLWRPTVSKAMEGKERERKRGEGSFEWVILHLAHPPTPPWKSQAQQLCLIRRIVLAATGSLYTTATYILHRDSRVACTPRIYTYSAAAHFLSFIPLSSTLVGPRSFFLESRDTRCFSLSTHSTKFRLNHRKLYYNANGTRQWDSNSVKSPYANLGLETVIISVRKSSQRLIEFLHSYEGKKEKRFNVSKTLELPEK